MQSEPFISDEELINLVKKWSTKPTICNYTELKPEIKCEKPINDPINHPAHYTSGGIETINYIEAKLNFDQYEGFLLGNILKYISRYPLKGGKEDLKKAKWYLNKLLEIMED